MKVLSFLQFYDGLTSREKINYLDYIGIINKENYKDKFEADSNDEVFNEKYYFIISQEFKPELVYKYFDIDTYEGLEGIFYEDILIQDFLGNSIEFSADDNYYYLNGLATYIPRTLDQFITDCQRAGIELQWKNQNDK